MLNKKFGMLLVISEAERVKGRRRFLCKCDCGKEKIARMESLNNGNCKSCGCLRKKITAERMRTHGMSGSRIYDIWNYMKVRCENKNYKFYKDYGGRGIKILWCSFEEFYKDMGPTYKDGLTIDRIDNNGHYCKENCRWANAIEQANNKRNNHIVNYNGREHTLTQIARENNICPKKLELRLRRGRDIEKALFNK